ncbi:K-box region and MADS-box transcription factor family protein [Prunus dulcis]|uniref:K-box region and MADS-box transcription factor family protein n=1 Tax=Prunus dulcis TaxID=3755 RepID=A0A4Y1RXU7_PRUDU|nr:K-box region and MADS-box transcription factor family protein [Prunus dulcis]
MAKSFCMSQLESSTSAALNKEIAENTHELRGASYNRKLMGEELQELNMKELQELEKLLGTGLRRVRDAKGEFFLKEVTSLKWKEFCDEGSQMMQENKRLKQAQMANRQVQTLELEQGQSSEPIGDFIHSDPSQDHDSSDTSLKLGLVYSTRFT